MIEKARRLIVERFDVCKALSVCLFLLLTVAGCVVREHPSVLDARLCIDRGIAHAQNGQHEEAIFDFSKAIKINPSSAAAYYNRGLAYHDRGLHDQAVSDYTKAIEISPGVAELYTNRGTAYLSKAQYGEAISDCTKAVELNPRSRAAYWCRGIAYGSIGQIEKACADLKRACELGECAPYERAKTEGFCK